MLIWLERIITVVAVLTALEVIGFCIVGRGSALTQAEMEGLEKQIAVTSGHGSMDLQTKLREEGWDKYLKDNPASGPLPGGLARDGKAGKAGPAGSKGSVGKGKGKKDKSGKRGDPDKKDKDSEVGGFELTESTDDWEWRDIPGTYRDAVMPDLRSAVDVLAQAGSQLIDMPDGSKAFKITGITQGSVIENAGFLPGDVLISVNGEPVSGNQDAMRLYNKFRNETQFVVVIERNGQRKQLFYNIK